METKEINEVFKKLGIRNEKSFNNLEYKDEGLYTYGRPLGKGERIIIKTF